MIESKSVASADPFGPADHIAVERGLAEFRSGRPVVINSRSGSVAALPIDGMTDGRLAAFRQLCAPAKLHVVVTASRARALGLDANGPVGLALPENANAATLFSLVADAARQAARRYCRMPAPMRRLRSSWPSLRSDCRRCCGGCHGECRQHRRADARWRRRGPAIPPHGDRFARGRSRSRRAAQRRASRRVS